MAQLEPEHNSDSPESLDNLYSLLGDLISDGDVAELASSQKKAPQAPQQKLNTQKPSKFELNKNTAQSQFKANPPSNISKKKEVKATKPQKKSPESISKPKKVAQDSLPIKPEIVLEPVNEDFDATTKTSNFASDFKYTSKIQKNEPYTSSLLQNSEYLNSDQVSQLYTSQQWIIEKEKRINELAANVESLLPLIVQLSKTQAENSEEYLLKAIVPLIDRVIKERAEQDNNFLAAAIANLLPDAIQREITDVPQSIGKAIAPELALSITEQIKLDQDAIAEALGSEMGKAIKTQIEMERDAMVDALYPVIGSTISKYMAEVVESINQKVDSALSPEGIKRKIRAKIQGVSEAELIFKESFPFRVRAAFLIKKGSGLVIAETQSDMGHPLESDLLAGMLTAIRSFANDCIADDSELDEIDYGQFQILFETAGYCYLAVVVDGEPDRVFREEVRGIFSKTLTRYGDEIKAYEGDPGTIPSSMQTLLDRIVIQEVQISAAKKSSKALYWVIGGLLGAILLPLGFLKYRAIAAQKVEDKASIILDATPELSVYRLIPTVKKNQLILEGRVPNDYLRSLASSKIQPWATEKELELNNQIIAVDVPPDPSIIAQEIARTTTVLNKKLTAIIETKYENQTVTVNGLILDGQEQQNILAAFQAIPGVENTVFVIEQQLPSLSTQIYFASGSTTITTKKETLKIDQIVDFLQRYPLIGLKILGQSDPQGDKQTNLKLATSRAQTVYKMLVAKGIDSRRLEIATSKEPMTNVSQDQPLWLSRTVSFESFLSSNN